jgi:hypothetical protein
MYSFLNRCINDDRVLDRVLDRRQYLTLENVSSISAKDLSTMANLKCGSVAPLTGGAVGTAINAIRTSTMSPTEKTLGLIFLYLKIICIKQ